VSQHPGDEDAMGDEFQPGVHKAGSFGGSQDVEGIAAHKKIKNESKPKVQQSIIDRMYWNIGVSPLWLEETLQT